MAPKKSPPKPLPQAARPPLDDQTEPSFDDEPHEPSLDQAAATEAVARELLTQLVRSRMPASSLSEGMTHTDAAKPSSLEDPHDQPTKVLPPVDAVSLDMGDLTSDGLARLHAQHAGGDSAASEFEVELTAPGLVPAARTGADALKEKRGDIAQLLASIAPFLWSLEAAEKWVRDRAHGDPEGEAHARSLALLARVLGQLQARIDEAQKNIR